MSKRKPDDLSNLSMLELFRVETENQTAILTSGLLALERDPAAPQQLEMLMRAAHSLKGAARIVNLQPAVRVAHALEDCFVAAQRGTLQLHQPEIDLLFRGVDLLQHLGKQIEGNPSDLEDKSRTEIQDLLNSLARLALPQEPSASSLVKVPQPGPPIPVGPPSSGGRIGSD